MSEQNGFFSRLGNFFKADTNGAGSTSAAATAELPPEPLLTGEEEEVVDPSSNGHDTELTHPVEASRTSFLRPWAKRDAAIVQLQDGFTALTSVMGAVKDSLDKQHARQDELIEVLRAIPAAGAAQTETLQAISQQLRQQNNQQQKISEILEQVSDAKGDQKQILTALKDRVETLGDQDRIVADSLSSVGAAMQNVSLTSQGSAQVLEQMRDNMNSRDGELQSLMQKQGSRYTTMLAIAIFLSISALAAVCGIGYLLMTKGHF